MKQPKKAQVSTSGFFPADSQFDNPGVRGVMEQKTGVRIIHHCPDPVVV